MAEPSVETLRLTSNLGPMFRLGPESIRRLDKGKEDVFAYDNVTRVRTLLIGGGGVIELSAGDGRKMVVVSSREMGRGSKRLNEPARGEYIAFATELHRRLVATGNSIQFVRGMLFKRGYDPLAIPESVLP